MRDKKTFPHPARNGYVYKLDHRGDDMSKRWVIHYQEGGKRKAKYGHINKGKSFYERYAYALEVLQELYEEHREVTPVNEARERVEKWFEKQQIDWADKTYSCYRQVFTEYFNALKADKPTEEFTDRYLLNLRHKLHANTYNKRLQFLRRILKACGYDWVMAEQERLKKVASKPSRYLEDIHRRRIVELMREENPDLMFFCQLLYQSFLRPKEALRIRVGDILWSRKAIRVEADIGKTSTFNTAPIPDCFLPVLRNRFLNTPPNHYLFPSRHFDNHATKHLSYTTIYNRWCRCVKEKGGYGEGFDLYSWRHTAAINARLAGADLYEIQRLMRHSDISVTVNYFKSQGVHDIQTYYEAARPIDD